MWNAFSPLKPLYSEINSNYVEHTDINSNPLVRNYAPYFRGWGARDSDS